MQTFFYEIVGRVVAIYLFVDSCREISNALTTKEIRAFNGSLLNWSSRRIVQKSAAPASYWRQIGIQGFFVVACFFIAIFGWPHSSK
jgi:hypothetical protein